MADVFISYARADEAFAERLAAVLEGLGLDVWWDRRLVPGDDWELKIEEELDAAKAAIVIWSSTSVKSREVRAEARRAMRQEKLLPVASEAVEPPLFSSGIHFENLSDWDGDTAAVEFQDLFAQLVALTGGVGAASHVPRDGVTKLQKIGVDAEAPILNVPWLHRPIGPFRSIATLIWALGVVGFTVAMGVWREDFFGPYWEGVFLLAASALLLFIVGERELQPHVKAMVARWLQPQPDAKPLRSTVAFLAMFEAVFSKNHFSFRCLWASALASVGLYAALLLLFVPMEVLQPLIVDLIENGPRAPEAEVIIDAAYVSRGFLEQNAALLFLAVPIANIVVDYFSLWQTRLVLRWSARGGPIALAVIVDFLLTAAIFVALLPLGPVAFVLAISALGGGVDEAALATAGQVAEEIWMTLYTFVTVGWPGEFLSAISGEANVPNTALLIAFFTTFTTSAWLWFALLFAPLVRLFSWTRRRGLSLLGVAINTRNRPIAPLGYAAAGLILVAGAVSSEVATAFSVKPGGARPAPLSVFQDCRGCPEMVALPGGRFMMGSPENEPGRFFNEGPQVAVSVEPFAIGRFEVSFREWDACVEETKHLPEGQRCRAVPRGQERFAQEFNGTLYQFPFGDRGWGRGLRPVLTITWTDAQAFLAWVTRKAGKEGVVYRLPTEAEWEYAARGGTETPYSFQGDPDEVGCAYMNAPDAAARRINEDQVGLNCDDGYAFTAPIGSYKPNPFGLYDMHGNLYEMVQDCYHNSYEGRPGAAVAWEEGCEGSTVLRGGAWYGKARFIGRSASREENGKDYRYEQLGFRVARSIAPAERAATEATP